MTTNIRPTSNCGLADAWIDSPHRNCLWVNAMKRNNTISWIEILIIDLALILAIGAMGASKSSKSTTDATKSSVVLASR